MILSSPRTRTLKTILPASVFTVVTIVMIFDQRNEIVSNPTESIFLLILAYACAAWTLWRPFPLRVADFVEDKGGRVYVRRGTKEAEINYSDIRDHEYLRIGMSQGVKLTFKEPNLLGSSIGFYLPEPVLNPGREDPIDYMERQIINARSNSA